jgi:antitoxin MazE
MMMQVRVTKWGNSLGVRIPQAYAECTKISEGTTVEVLVRDDEIVIRRKKYTLDDLLAKVTPDNIHGETDWGAPMGREEW